MADVFSDVPAFIEVVEAGGFSAAARRLDLSRSAIGKAVGRLEQRLGVRLFHRTTRRQGLTEEGQAYYEFCERALSKLKAGTALLEAGHTTVSGKLSVSMPVLFGRLVVAPVLIRLAALHPSLELELDFHDRHVDLVDGGIDLAIRIGPIGNGAGLMARRIARRSMIICASPAYIEEQGLPERLSDLANHRAVTYSRNGQRQSWIFPSEEASPCVMTPPTRLRFDDLGAILDATVAGFGLAWLPDWLADSSIASGQLVRILPELPTLLSDIHVLWPDAPHLPKRVRAAIDALAAELT